MKEMLEKELDFDDDPLNAMGVSRKSLVIFFLIDTSGSMKGTKMGELNTAMEELVPEIRRIGEADTDVKVAVLTFSTNLAWMYSEPISIEEFEWNRLAANGITNMQESVFRGIWGIFVFERNPSSLEGLYFHSID